MILVKFSAGDTILLQDQVYEENFVLDRDIAVALKGGYDCVYNEPPSTSSTIRSMTINNGTVEVKKIVISSPPGVSDPGVATNIQQQCNEFPGEIDVTFTPPTGGSWKAHGVGVEVEPTSGPGGIPSASILVISGYAGDELHFDTLDDFNNITGRTTVTLIDCN